MSSFLDISFDAPSDQELANAIRHLREMRGFTQEHLALAAGTSRQTIITLEATGAGRISTLLKIIHLLGGTLSIKSRNQPDDPEETPIGIDL